MNDSAALFHSELTAALSTLKHATDRMEAAADSLDYKLSELLDVRLDTHSNFSPLPPLLNKSRRPSSANAKVVPVSGKVKSDIGFATDADHQQRSAKMLFSAMKLILQDMLSCYDRVETVYEEIKVIVAINILSTPDITPTTIMSDSLMPYLSAANGLDLSLREKIWSRMAQVTGCGDIDTKRTLKRMVDNHYRGYKRKPADPDLIPTAMVPLFRIISQNRHGNAFEQTLDETVNIDLSLNLPFKKRQRLVDDN
uniref:Uncharacterized protein n=1 Tax=Spongospora subterranea TaxID=70186 RepID=A0A0H5RC41_9EUKA|eukprot:CRZ11177.1 hypothetical protein [Spongospora subterranea]